jgi:hypothetical protein
MEFSGYGHNPHPLGRKHVDRCCDRCNSEGVIPARLIEFAKPIVEKEAARGRAAEE